MSITKKKRVSKKNKVAWRKHVNIDDVEDFLEDQRLDERLGHLSEKPNEELFEIYTQPTEKKAVSKREARALLREKQPRCFEILQPLTQVPDPISKRNRVRTKEERKNELIKLKEKERRQKGILRSRELQGHIDRSLYKKQLDEKKQKKNYFKTDIWNTGSDPLVNNEWITDESKQHILFTLNKHDRNVPKSIQQKYSFLPPIEPPHPGTSYNPTLNDHRELLHKVVDKEKALMKQEKHILRVTSAMFKKVTPKEKQDDWLQEMSQGLNNTEPDNEGDFVSINPPVENKKKTLKQRRKQKEQVQLTLTRNIAKKEKKKVTDLRELRLLNKKLETKEKKLAEERQKRLNKLKNTKEVPKQLGAIKFEEEEIDFNLPQDIMGSLRNLKKEGSLLLDRFKSLQKRNILQPTVKRGGKVAKVKRFNKAGHQNDWKITVARSKDNLL